MFFNTLFVRVLFSFFICTVSVSAFAATPLSTSAKQAIVLDYETGTVLFEKNADQRMPTSSMSKVMSMYAVFEALQQGDISLQDTFKVSEKAWRKGGSKMFVNVNKQVEVEDLIRGVIVQSGNDAAIVLAEGLAGSETAFAARLNRIARGLGMNNSNFMNASGWPDPDHYSTAYDLSLLAKALIQNFPSYYPYYAEQEFSYNNITQRNRNPLLYRDIGADGIKTGHTEVGGYGLIGSGKQNGRRVIIVINGLEDEKARAKESAKLLMWGMENFENKTIFKAGAPVESVSVVLGEDKEIQAALKEDFIVTLPLLPAEHIKITARFQAPLIAPVKKGDEIGVLSIGSQGLSVVERPLYAVNDVKELGLVPRTLEKAKLFILDLWSEH